MKKIFFFIICLFNINIVYADSIPEFIPIIDKCQFISGNEANIPIKIISTDEGQLTTLIDKYKIGTIYNNGNISTTNQNIIIDTLKDNNQNSNVYLTIKDNLTIHKGEEITSFIINISLKDENNINILGNTIYFTKDKEICNIINNQDLTTYYDKIDIKENNPQENKKELNSLDITLIIISLMSIGGAVYGLSKKNNSTIKNSR